MLLRLHPAFYSKSSGIGETLVVGDVFTEHLVPQNACGAGSLAQAQSFRRYVREVSQTRHAFGVSAGHATDVTVPDKRRETIFSAHDVGLLKRAPLDIVWFEWCDIR